MKKIWLSSVCLVLTILVSCSSSGRESPDYPIRPVPFTSVRVTDDFWAPRIRTNHRVTIPIAFEQSEKTGRIRNFKIAAGLETGQFCSQYPFDDSDVYKIIEGAAYSLQTEPDPELEAYLDDLITLIAGAQEEDGYLYTYRTIMGDDSHDWVGKRWEKTHLLSHELYNLGHLYEAAVAYYQATGKRNLLDVAIRSADLVARDFGWGKRESYPGHQEIEIGLVKLYRVTGNRDYLDLARFFLEVRGPDGDRYNQAHLKVVEQQEAVGHAVRAAYMYSAMADVAAMTGDQAYITALNRIWRDIVFTKLYITGGIGATGGNEGFGQPYELPNLNAYCETCASIANVFWNHRMFLHQGEGQYYDVLERTLYNALLSGLSLSGDRFFYPNPLESDGTHQRQAWFGCACCPSNLSRFIPSVPGYIYATDDEGIYVNLFVDSTAEMPVSGKPVRIIQKTRYPWEGRVRITLNPVESAQFKVRVRVPGWARNEAVPGGLYEFVGDQPPAWSIRVNGDSVPSEVSGGFCEIDRLWQPDDRIELELPMPVRWIQANPRVAPDRGRLAVQRGPLVYCAEWPDSPTGKVRELVIDSSSPPASRFESDLLGGIRVVVVKGRFAGKEEEIRLIPYHLWAHRGPGEMVVWMKANGD